jgi:aromatic ring-cleaving dioxygenase
MTELNGYHAHVYYDPTTRPIAERLRDTIIGKFTVEPGGFSDEPRGPHPISQFSVIFRTEEFQNIVPWLMLNREGLDVLVHPLTESSYDGTVKLAESRLGKSRVGRVKGRDEDASRPDLRRPSLPR